MTKFIAEGFWDWKKGRSGGKGLRATIQAKIDATQQPEVGGKTFALTNISLKALPQEMSRGEYTRQQMAKPTKPTNRVRPSAETDAEEGAPRAVGRGERSRAADRYSGDGKANGARGPPAKKEPSRGGEKARDDEDCLDECCTVS